jgi:hypothetical protein
VSQLWQYLKLPLGAANQVLQISWEMNVEIIAPSIDPTLLPAIKTIVRAAIATNSAGCLRRTLTPESAAVPGSGAEEPILKLVILRVASQEC